MKTKIRFLAFFLILATMLPSLLLSSACKRKVNDFQTVVFGSYEQDGHLSNGQEPLEWIILETNEEEGYALLTTKYGIFAKAFYLKYGDTVYWNGSALRYWVKNKFTEKAFTPEEQKMMLTVPFYDEKLGKDNFDLVCLLTVEQAKTYFPDDSSRLLQPTEQAVNSKAYVNTFTQSGWWWLLNVGNKERKTAYVNSFGAVIEDGNYSTYKHALVRPVIRVKLEAIR